MANSDDLSSFLNTVQERDRLHRWIDSQPPSARFLCLVEIEDEDDSRKQAIRFMNVGDQTISESAWICETYIRRLHEWAENSD
jgi:hypothetical protein